MDEIVDRVAKVENTASAVQEDAKKMKPTMDEVLAWSRVGLAAFSSSV